MKVLLAIDDSAYSQAAVSAAIAQFRPEGTDVRVLNAVDWPAALPESLEFTPGALASGPVMSVRDDARRQSEQLLVRTAQQLRAAGFTVSHETREGDPRHVILQCAGEWQPDVIVLGSHGRTGLDRFLLGSVAENVVRHASSSVAIIRGVR